MTWLVECFDSDALRSAAGDVFGRVYEYFLVEFAKEKAHDNGEFFTPPSLVQTIVNVIEPDHGVVLDPACGSGGMFVQSVVSSSGVSGSHNEAKAAPPGAVTGRYGTLGEVFFVQDIGP